MNWIDAHSHLTDLRIAAELPAMLDACARAGITRFVLGGIDPADWEKQKQLARAHPRKIFPTFGLHPWWVAKATAGEVEAGLRALRTELDRADRACVGVGEMGLDFQTRISADSHGLQIEAFRSQLRISIAARLPIVLHVVQAHEPTLEILRGELRSASIERISGIVHSFADEPRVARAYLDLGLTPSISAAVITRGSGPSFEKLKQTMLTLSAKDFVLETDAPDQPPYPRPPKGEPLPVNAPVNLLRVAEVVAALRGESRETILDQCRDRSQEIFRIKP